MPKSSACTAPPAPVAGARIRLPIVAGAPRLRRSRTSRWRAGVLIGVHLLVAAHLAHWLATGSTLTPVEPSEAMELGRRGLVNAGAIFFAVAILATALFGRFFCGWGCHLVALQDLCRWLLEKIGIRPRPLGSRALAWVPALAFFYMFLWPALYRLAAGAPAPALRFELTTSAFWATFPGWAVALATFLTCGFAAVYLLGAKGFCSYACPYGAIFGAADRLAPGRIRVTDACSGCGHCTAVCTSNVRVHEEVALHRMVVDPGCMKCMDCVSVCPNDALYFGWGRPSLLAPKRAAPAARRPALGLGDELFLAAVFALAFSALRGLYGVFPFLFALGLAGCLAYLALVARRLAREPNVALRSIRLKSAGRLLRPGWSFVALVVALGLGVAHSGAVQLAAASGMWSYRQTEPLRRRADAGAAGAVSGEERFQVRAALARLDRARRWGALPQPELDLPLVELALVGGDVATARRVLAQARPGAEARADLAYAAGLVEARAGDVEAAAARFRRALELDPGFRAARENLAGALTALGRTAEARALLEGAPDRGSGVRP